MTTVNTWSNAQLFEQYSAILGELRRRDVTRTNNAPAGDYAEWLVQRALGGRLAPNSEKSFDLETEDGTRVQVKARAVSEKILAGQRQMSSFRTWAFDQAAMVQFAKNDYSIVRAVLVPVEQVRDSARWTKHVNGHVAFMTEALMTSPGSTNITDAVRAASESTPAEVGQWAPPGEHI
jgi:hypothetical protein